MTNQKLFGFQHYRVVLFLLLSFCSRPPATATKAELSSYQSAYDLTRLVGEAEYSGPDFQEETDLAYHWKKNPGRYSSLAEKKKWQNTQVTFNTDKRLFINQSLDSILFLPDSNYRFRIEPGEYLFESFTGLLPLNGQDLVTSGTLELLSGGTIILSKEISAGPDSLPGNIKFLSEFSGSLSIRWKSRNGALYLGSPVLSKKRSEKKFNIIFIVIDAVRKDSQGFAGSPYHVSPNVDKISGESVIFKNAFVNANWTKPSMSSMFYSDYSSSLGLGNIGFPVSGQQKALFYGKKRTSVTEFFRNNGYYTGAAMNNVFFLDYTGVGIDLGFHEIIQIGRDIEDTERITDEAIAFIKRNREKAFFLHINWNTPHGSYVPPTSVMRKLREENKANNFQALHPNAQRYLGEIRFTDDEIGKFIDALKKEKLYDESVIIITSDHGEVLNDYHDSANNPNGGTIFGHGESLFDEELNVPFLIKYPVSIRQKIKNNLVAGQSSLLSFLPTLAGLVGFPDQEKGWKGKDYSQYIFGKTGEIKEDVIYSEGRLSESIRTENFKYIRKYPGFVPANNSVESKFSGKREELYDLKNDPTETENLAGTDPQFLMKARSLMENYYTKRNRFILRFPVCKNCIYSGVIQPAGGIYRIVSANGFSIQNLSRREFSFSGRSTESPSSIVIETIYPLFGVNLRISKNSIPEDYRVGRWGISSSALKGVSDSRLFSSSSIPPGIEKSPDVWIYNDAGFSGTDAPGTSAGMGEEVRGILKSWGYIHE